MSKLSELKNSPSFLQKFKDRKQVIDRQGLLKLLNLKRESLQKKNKNTNAYDNNNVDTKETQVRNNQLQNASKSRSIRNEQTSSKSSSLYKGHIPNIGYEKQDINKNMQYNKMLKLPSINKTPQKTNTVSKSQSSSHTQKLSKLGMKLKSEHSKQLESEMSQSSITKNKKFELDKYALRHLQFLNRFERQVVNTRLSSGQKAILNYKYD